MAAITTRLLNLRPVLRPNSHSLRHFSSSSEPEPEPESTSQNQTLTQSSSSSFSSYLNDVKASLQREPQPQNRLRRPQSFASASQSPSKLDEIRRNLSEYRPRSAAPPPAASGQYISFLELYKRKVISESDDSSAVKTPSFDSIRDSLGKMQKNQVGFGGKERLKVKLDQDKPLIVGGSDGDGLPSLIFGREERKGSEEGGMRTALFKSYAHSELGRKLQTLRPDKKRGNWFSLRELNDRLVRLREIEEKESRGSGDLTFKHLRESLVKLKSSDDEKSRERTMQRLDVLGQLGGTPTFMLSPPKEHLVEKYFHPDNMSSAEKLKLELQKVRDEFKMSESDCGSARVQVAQLTTKIKHLSTVLQKKDKHSRKGLQAMVQRRKKLLKYLRRTDWDSYSLLLSKLGLRDNPDVKA